MGRSRDRISDLPDPILHTILSMMPLKSAIRTSTLSTRWRYLWEYNLISSTSLDFTDDFSNSQSPKRFVDNINRYIQLHSTKNLHKFQVLFCPFDVFLLDVQSWIVFATSKGVKELDLDLSQGFTDPRNGEFVDGRSLFQLPICLFECKSLTHLRLSRCDLYPDLDFSGLGNLQSLHLKHVDISEANLQRLLTDCKLLESLSLDSYLNNEAIRIVASDSRLKKLTVVDNWRAFETEVTVSKLQSFHYYGQLCYASEAISIPSLVDAFICPFDGRRSSFDLNFIDVLSQVSHVKVLTVNTTMLVEISASEELRPDAFPVELQNLQELQLLVDSLAEEHLTCIYDFFRLCPSPSIEKLFIQLTTRDQHDQSNMSQLAKAAQRPQKVDFSILKVIKVSNFRGSTKEMILVKYLLEQAVALDTLILVGPPTEGNIKHSSNEVQTDSLSKDKPLSGRTVLGQRILRGQLQMLPKASPQASVILCEFLDNDTSLNPVHADVYSDYCNLKKQYDVVSSIESGVNLVELP